MALRGLETFLKEDESSTAGKPGVTINQIEALNLLEENLKNDKFWGQGGSRKSYGKEFYYRPYK